MSKEYSNCEWNEEKKQAFYYKIESVDITEEEYQTVVEAYNATKKAPKKEKTTNGVFSLLVTIAIITFIVGFIASFAWAELFFVGWIATFLSGSMLLGFAQIIKLLHEIKEIIDNQ